MTLTQNKYPNTHSMRPTEVLGIKLYMGTTFAVILLMMFMGIAMRASQAGWLNVPADKFYQLLTMHGAGMVGIAGLGGAGVMWAFLRRYVHLNAQFLHLNYAFFMTGVLLILGAIFIGGYSGGWTFLWPLPAKSMGVWSANAAAAFIAGLLFIGVGFLAFYFDAALAITRQYGSILHGLGLNQLISGKINKDHPPTVVASSMVIIVNVVGILVGAIVLAVTLANLYFPELTINPLLAKNMIYFFGHVFINASIYMAVIAVYELLPLYTGRPWKVSRVFYAAWACVTLFVMAVYPHHLLLDGVMPKSLLAMGQIVSYLSGIPVLLVTVYGALMLVYKANVQWDAPARWLLLSMFGWAIGVIPAIVDGTIHANKVMHNTTWVPGHFHLYLLVGLLPMLIGFSLYAFDIKRGLINTWQNVIFWAFAMGGTLFCVTFLLGGWASVPRRWATHWTEWMAYDRAGTVFGALVITAMLFITAFIIKQLFAGRYSDEK
ncbi:MAG: cbb3-type cytochrome c oxidase subunit I [Methylotenera sp.]